MNKNLGKIESSSFGNDGASSIDILCHEVKNPLNGVMGYAALLGETNLSEEQKDFVSGIKRSSQQLLNVIDNVLFTSNQNIAIFSIAELINVLGTTVHTLLLGKKVSFIVSTFDDLDILLKGNMTSVYQILLNLIVNSLKFTDSGFVELSITRNTETKDDVKLVFTVSDTGHGIHENNLARLFLPFFQEESNLKINKEGRGLGLHIVKKILDQIGGNISVQSYLNVGSKFSVNIQFNKVIQEFPNSVSNQSIDLRLKKPERKYKILVVDDCQINRLLFQKILEQRGFLVIVTGDCATAKKYTELFDFDLILTDYMMPDGSGVELINYIKIKTTSISKVVLITALDEIKTDEFTYADLILKKPIDPELLFSKVNGLLNL